MASISAVIDFGHQTPSPPLIFHSPSLPPLSLRRSCNSESCEEGKWKEGGA